MVGSVVNSLEESGGWSSCSGEWEEGGLPQRGEQPQPHHVVCEFPTFDVASAGTYLDWIQDPPAPTRPTAATVTRLYALTDGDKPGHPPLQR